MSKLFRVPDYLEHILKAIERINRYTEQLDEIGFLSSELVQDAVIRNIEIIGEASNNIMRAAPDFTAQHKEIPWPVMYAMRNRLSHGYDKVDFEIVWRMIERDLPALHTGLMSLMANAKMNAYE